MLASVVFMKEPDKNERIESKFGRTALTNSNDFKHDTVHFKQDHEINQNKIGKRRDLSFDIDVSQTTVCGLSDFEVGQNKTITATPRDSLGIALGSGYEIYIQVSNQ